MVTTVHCPQCQKLVTWDDKAEWKPFCSERCKLIDLGDWAVGNHKIAGQATDNSLDDLDDYSEYH
tara:strand:- start:500 stop:694 length:195 start_codon:yes stop_codon:yes gene_type:complete